MLLDKDRERVSSERSTRDVRALALLLAALVTAVSCTGDEGLNKTRAREKAQPHTAGCPVTLPNGSTPPGETPNPDYHGNGSLWTSLWPEGRIVTTKEDVRRNGSIAMKFPWWRGVEGELTITGRNLDGPAPPVRAEIPRGYGDTGFQASGVLFPTAGCWRVTGKVGEARLTFVALVEVGRGDETPTRGSLGIVVTRDDHAIVRACRPASVAQRLIRFSRALSKADEAALRRFWGAGFKWFSVGGRSPTGSARWHFVAYRPEKAVRYVEERRGLSLRVEELEVAPRAGFRGADIVYAGRWMGTGRSGPKDRSMSGKGFVDCLSDTIRVWSMVLWERGAGPKGHLCPEPGGRLSPGILLACLRKK
jgi:hypothetical protein